MLLKNNMSDSNININIGNLRADLSDFGFDEDITIEV